MQQPVHQYYGAYSVLRASQSAFQYAQPAGSLSLLVVVVEENEQAHTNTTVLDYTN